jgi:hypothetical protein
MNENISKSRETCKGCRSIQGDNECSFLVYFPEDYCVCSDCLIKVMCLRACKKWQRSIEEIRAQE